METKQGLKKEFRELAEKLNLKMEAEFNGLPTYIWPFPLLKELVKRVKKSEVEIKCLKKKLSGERR